MEAETAVSHLGIITLLPTLLVLFLAITLRRPIEALLLGAISGILLLHGSDFVTATAETTLRVMQDDELVWVILVCGSMGSLIGLFIRTGSLAAFVNVISKRAKTKAHSLLATWLLGITLFVDDYLNCITLGAAMRRLTDTYKSSREMLAYIIDSTAAPVSVLIPLSTWGVFFSQMLEENGLAGASGGWMTYVSGIPYMLYPWIALFMVPAVATGKIPLIGPMKAAEKRAAGGVCIPPEAEAMAAANETIVEKPGVKGTPWLFVLSMASLIGFTVYYDMEFLPAVYTALALLIVGIIAFKILDHNDTFDTVLNGFKTMLEALAIIFAAYVLKDINGQLGFTAYIMEVTRPYMSAETLPFIIFAIMGLVSFATGSAWGMFVVAMPVVAELTLATGASIPLVVGAVLSASTFGSHACLYADATVLTAQSSGCTALQHALTQLPYALIAATLSLIGFALLV